MKAMGYARWAEYSHSESWYAIRYVEQSRRTLWIKNWADRMMKTVPENCRQGDRQVLVTYEDLINVWDKADRIWFNLGD
jgi:hypothetical protein